MRLYLTSIQFLKNVSKRNSGARDIVITKELFSNAIFVITKINSVDVLKI